MGFAALNPSYRAPKFSHERGLWPAASLIKERNFRTHEDQGRWVSLRSTHPTGLDPVS